MGKKQKDFKNQTKAKRNFAVKNLTGNRRTEAYLLGLAVP